jgi:hypothetical protein
MICVRSFRKYRTSILTLSVFPDSTLCAASNASPLLHLRSAAARTALGPRPLPPVARALQPSARGSGRSAIGRPRPWAAKSLSRIMERAPSSSRAWARWVLVMANVRFPLLDGQYSRGFITYGSTQATYSLPLPPAGLVPRPRRNPRSRAMKVSSMRGISVTASTGSRTPASASPHSVRVLP